MTNASGPAALAETTLESGGWSPQPVVDLSTFAGDYREVLVRALENPGLDVLFVIFSPVGLSRGDEAGAVLGEVVRAARAAGNSKTVLCCFTGAHAPIFAEAERLPSYRFPESAARALARVHAYAVWRREPLGQLPIFGGLEVRWAQRIFRAARAARRLALSRTGHGRFERVRRPGRAGSGGVAGRSGRRCGRPRLSGRFKTRVPLGRSGRGRRVARSGGRRCGAPRLLGL